MVLQKRYRYPWHWELDDAISSERSGGVGVADVKLTRGVTDVAASIGGWGVVAHWVPDNATSSAIVGPVGVADSKGPIRLLEVVSHRIFGDATSSGISVSAGVELGFDQWIVKQSWCYAHAIISPRGNATSEKVV